MEGSINSIRSKIRYYRSTNNGDNPSFIILDYNTLKTLKRDAKDELFLKHTLPNPEDGDKIFGIVIAITTSDKTTIEVV